MPVMSKIYPVRLVAAIAIMLPASPGYSEIKVGNSTQCSRTKHLFDSDKR